MIVKGTLWGAILLAAATMAVTQKLNSRVKRGGFLFPENSGMGIFLAIAVPVDLPQYELSVSYNFEANYLLPDNITVLELAPQLTQIRYARSLTRTRVYDVLEQKLKSEGLIGRICLLRTICETATEPVEAHNGLLGDIIHIVFTPSSSTEENIPPEFAEAEKTGREQGRNGCSAEYSECPIDIYELFSVWDK